MHPIHSQRQDTLVAALICFCLTGLLVLALDMVLGAHDTPPMWGYGQQNVPREAVLVAAPNPFAARGSGTGANTIVIR